METAISQFSRLPQSKEERKTFVEMAVNEILSGNSDPLQVEIYLKNIEETINQIRKDEKVKEILLIEAEKYGQKTFDFNGNNITVTSRSTYDFSECNHSELNEINNEISKLTERKKQIEKELSVISKEIADVDTGDIIYPATKKTTQFLTIKLK